MLHSSFPSSVYNLQAAAVSGKQRVPLPPNSIATVIPFPIKFQGRLLDDLQREASAARDPDRIQLCLRAACRRHGDILRDKGVASERIEAEMRSMAVMLTGSDTYERDGKPKLKRQRRKRAA
jgi:hypothetical protein